MSSITGVSNQSYRKLFKGRREKLIKNYEGDDSDAGKLARLVRRLEYAVVMADKEGIYFNRCPICNGLGGGGRATHASACEWPDLIKGLRER